MPHRLSHSVYLPLYVLGLLLALTAQAQDLPLTFDLRAVQGKNLVTAIKNQQGGTCWTHGAMAAIESNLSVSGAWSAAGEYGEPDLAEYHLDWWNGFNQHYNADLIPPDGKGLEVHYGGDCRIVAAYIARGEGPVREIDAPSFGVAPLQDQASYRRYYARDIEWYSPATGDDFREVIKSKIMTFGVMGTCMCYDRNFISTLSFTHFQPPESPADPNHAIAIIGWNDTLRTQASQPGAWLCKNSWGSGWGLEGYFWISYYDKHCTIHPEMGAVSFQNVQPQPFAHFYHHDYHGWRDTLPEIREAFNAFTAAGDELLQAVSFFTAADKVTYLLKIFDRFNDGQLLAERLSQSGELAFSGFHTVDLRTHLPLAAGDDFYIYLQLSRGGHPIDRTSEVPVLLGAANQATIVESSAQPGQSFHRSGLQWQDLYKYSFQDPSWNHSANFCIKALTNDRTVGTDSWIKRENPRGFELLQNYPNPFNAATRIDFRLLPGERAEIRIFNLAGETITTCTVSSQHDGVGTMIWDGRDASGKRVSSGLYFYRLESQERVQTRKMTLLP